MPDRCFNGVEDVGEVQVDCGKSAGLNARPARHQPDVPFAENSNDWGLPTWDNAGTITHPATIGGGSTMATHGTQDLQLTHCNFAEVHSVPFSGTKFEIVGDGNPRRCSVRHWW